MFNELLREVWFSPAYVKGNLARQNAPEIAAMASLGLITTQRDRETFGGQWLITQKGLEYLWAE
jgi:hypothetical protein